MASPSLLESQALRLLQALRYCQGGLLQHFKRVFELFGLLRRSLEKLFKRRLAGRLRLFGDFQATTLPPKSSAFNTNVFSCNEVQPLAFRLATSEPEAVADQSPDHHPDVIRPLLLEIDLGVSQYHGGPMEIPSMPAQPLDMSSEIELLWAIIPREFERYERKFIMYVLFGEE
jgi:hypothetical protein